MSDIKNNPTANRYELRTGEHLSVADYQLRGNDLRITHVEVPEALRGKGIAAELMKGVVEDASAKGLNIVPICPYAVTYMQRHPQTS